MSTKYNVFFTATSGPSYFIRDLLKGSIVKTRQAFALVGCTALIVVLRKLLQTEKIVSTKSLNGPFCQKKG